MFQAGTALRLCQALGQYLRRPCAFRQSSWNFSRSSSKRSGFWALPEPAVLCEWGTLSHFFPSMPFPNFSLPSPSRDHSRLGQQHGADVLIWGDSHSSGHRIRTGFWAVYCPLQAPGLQPEYGPGLQLSPVHVMIYSTWALPLPAEGF